MNFLKKFRRHEKGAPLVEYVVLLGLISIVAIVSVLNLGTTVRDQFTSISQTLSSSIASSQEFVSTPGGGAGGGSGPAPVGPGTIIDQWTIMFEEHPYTSNVVGYSRQNITPVDFGNINQTQFGLFTIRAMTQRLDTFAINLYVDGDQSGQTWDMTFRCNNGYVRDMNNPPLTAGYSAGYDASMFSIQPNPADGAPFFDGATAVCWFETN
jgi:Flp pilus assembly pilin Flp